MTQIPPPSGTKVVVQRVDDIVVVRTTGQRLVNHDRPNALLVEVMGLQGPPGPAGSSYLHVQPTPAATWIVVHNLGRRVSVTIFDADDEIVHADVEEGSANTLSITFPYPVSGSALVL